MRELESEADKNPISLIAREVAIMKKLDHPNLVHLYEVLDVPLSDSIFMVLEFCPGGILLDLPLPTSTLDPIPMDLSVARTYFGQVLMGLEYLHENDVVHRDIKPENILLTVDKKTAKMCDFGVSEMFARKGDDRVKKGMGSPAFMSPESVEGGQEMGAKMADGEFMRVTLYCMFTGHLPFTHDNPLELFEAIKTEEFVLFPPIPSHWPEHQTSLIQGMLDRNVEARLTVDGIRNHPWMSEADLPSKEDNLSEDRMVREPTPEEIKKAVRSVSSAL
ncbi:kinase-like domain-containing protein [Mrakia frigida]|uniref:serine/threonine-protein kinase n=1 Tax=Mrakia frigida TaxID=29902 RepID=UPI003FCC13F0